MVNQHESLSLVVNDFGYAFEAHENVETQDGYQLTLHRIPCAKNPQTTLKKRPPVLLMHGMCGSSEQFIFQGKYSLACLLVEAGFDVWLGNVRGVSHSRNHKVYNYSQDNSYWEFSMHEMGVYDLPAMIDYILSVTTSPKLHYAGYSQGSVIFFIMCSERPEYASKITLAAGLSPVLFVKGAAHPWLPVVSKFEKNLNAFVTSVGLCGLRVGFSRRHHYLFTSHCLGRAIIRAIAYGSFGTSSSRISKDCAVALVKYQQGVNYQALFHAMQMYNSGQFLQYDAGPNKNMERYGSEKVRDYRVANATCPVVLYYSEQDWFMPGENVKLITAKLPNLVGAYKVHSDGFSHFDFLLAEEAIEKIYKPLVQHFLDFC